jgi:fructuronate reductase
MKALNNINYPKHINNVNAPNFNRCDVKSSIVHFGVGNFHRCHQAVYCDDLLNQGELDWGVVGVSLRSTKVRDALASQDFLYTQATLGEETQYRVISSLSNILVAPEDPNAVVKSLADEQTQVVTITITEKGYCLRDGIIDVKHEAFKHDLQSLSKPQSIYGFLAAGIIRRLNHNGSAFSIMCCDNMQGGGECLAQGVNRLLKQHSELGYIWAQKNVSFISTMVDRVSPATSQSLKDSIAHDLAFVDQWPVSAEPFSQWVIEDNFAGKKPPFEQVGALFVKDIAPFENMKLRFLNAGHSIVSAIGYLAGKKYIHQALASTSILSFVKQTLVENILEVSPVPNAINAGDYIEKVLARFQNSALPYAVLQVGSDSSQKIQQRLYPSIEAAIISQSDSKYLSFSLAAWLAYIDHAIVQKDLNDPLTAQFKEMHKLKLKQRSKAYLELAGAAQYRFYSNNHFMQAVLNDYMTISEHGIEQALGIFNQALTTKL